MANPRALRRIRARILIAARGRTRFNASCPACEAHTHRIDRKHALWVDLGINRFRCFRCGIGGEVFPRDKKDWAPQDPHEIEAALIPFPPHYQLLSESGRSHRAYINYAKKRHIPPELWDQLHVGFCDNGPYSGRLILPIVNAHRLEGWVARSVLPVDRSYLYPKGMTRGHTMFNAARLREDSPRPILVVEGWLDAIFLWPDAVAVLGMPSRRHMEMLSDATSDVVFVLDGDAWRQSEAFAMALRLNGKRAAFVRLPPTLDPDDMDRDHIHSLALRALKDQNDNTQAQGQGHAHQQDAAGDCGLPRSVQPPSGAGASGSAPGP